LLPPFPAPPMRSAILSLPQSPSVTAPSSEGAMDAFQRDGAKAIGKSPADTRCNIIAACRGEHCSPAGGQRPPLQQDRKSSVGDGFPVPPDTHRSRRTGACSRRFSVPPMRDAILSLPQSPSVTAPSSEGAMDAFQRDGAKAIGESPATVRGAISLQLVGASFARPRAVKDRPYSKTENLP